MTKLALLALPLALAGCPDKKETPATPADAAPDTPAPVASGPVHAIPIPSASVAAAIGADKLPAYTGPTGSLEGTIYVTGDPAPDVHADFAKCPSGVKTYGKLFREGAPNAAGARPLADAIVGVTGYSGYYIPEKREAKDAVLEDCAFTHRTIDLTYGQRLDITNKTDALFAPALSGSYAPALMVAMPHGDAVRLYPPKPGYYTISDRFDGVYLKADVYVLLHPLHAVSDLDGHFRIDGIPAKTKLTVFARLATIGETAKDVEVLAGVVSKIDLTLSNSPRDAGAPDAGKAKDAGGYVPPK